KNPFKRERGMSFYYDLIDWLGGYPYEYASIDEVVDCFSRLGFSVLRVKKASVPTGCNEYLFKLKEDKNND
ncbi:MAG: class I SAM-dependent methyltransferase, partial [Candidatus Omnitrophica bacterium]|nr:class I SAM-dependent methyltransferase [Candidatus Omnitrophota bacterium]